MSEENAVVAQKRTSKRKVRTGVVRSDKMDKTITVDFKSRKKHPLYKKMLPYTKRLTAHDEKNEAKSGDLVELMETKPLSKTKRWRLVKILDRAK